MKIFFTASKRGKNELDSEYKLLYDTIQKLQYKHVDDLIITDVKPARKSITDEENTNIFLKSIHNLKTADINIFECSIQSFVVGYLVQKSIELNKPTILLFHDDYEISPFVTGIDEDKLLVLRYNSKNAAEILASGLIESSQLADKRFNFFISPRLLTFLKEESRKLDMSKSTFIRNLIKEHKKKSKQKEG